MKGIVEQLDIVGPGVLRERPQPAHIAVESAVREKTQPSGKENWMVAPPLANIRLADQGNTGYRPAFESTLHRGERNLLVPRHHFCHRVARRESDEKRSS